MNKFIQRMREHPVIALFCFIFLMLSVTAATYETVQLNRALGRDVTRYVATDGSIALRIQYIGTAAIGSATIAVESNGDLTFLNNAGTADTGVGLPTKNGTIDVSDASADTWGEVADGINASVLWRCTLVDVLPSKSSNDILTAVSATAVGLTNPEGRAFTYNTADADYIFASVGPEYTVNAQLTTSGNKLLNRQSTPRGNPVDSPWQNELLYVSASAAYTSGAPDLVVYACQDRLNTGNLYAGSTEILLWKSPGALTGAFQTIPILPAQAPIKAPPGWRLVAGYLDTSTPDLTAATIQVHGLSYLR